MLRDAIYKYHSIDRRFNKRLELLENLNGVSLKHIYRILSAHIHSQSPMSTSQAKSISGLVSSVSFSDSVVEIQRQCADSLSNFLFSVYCDSWPSLPEMIVQDVIEKLNDAQRQEFFGLHKKK